MNITELLAVSDASRDTGYEEERRYKAAGNNFEKVRFPRLNVKVLNVTRAARTLPFPAPFYRTKG